MTPSRQIVLASRPAGMPTPDNFELVEQELGDPADGQVLVEVSHISVDAFIRTTMEDGGIHATVPLGSPVIALGVGKVIASAHGSLSEGDWVTGPTFVQTHALLPGDMFQKIDASIAPPSAYLGVLGLTTGLTAYVGLLEVIDVRAEETVVVSAAAGAVGSVACQLAKIRGARVIGIAGGPDKCRYLTETIGAHGAVDYKGEDVGEALDRLAPDGIDVFFDNVGGELLDTVLDRIRTGARVSVCGAISQYDHLDDVRGPKLYLRLAERNASMSGFTVDHYAAELPRITAELSGWLTSGEIVLPEHIEAGLDRFPAALNMLFTGGHTGKLLVTP